MRSARVDGDADLGRFVGHEMSRRLDRSRPLWELTVIDGLDGGRTALLAKMHHALVDGVGAVDIGTVLLDPTDEPMQLPAESPWEPRQYDRRRHLAKLAAAPLGRAQRLMTDAFVRALEADPMRAAGDLRKATELVVQLAKTRPAGADDAAQPRARAEPPLRPHERRPGRDQGDRQGRTARPSTT